jgi:hypothetical protein
MFTTRRAIMATKNSNEWRTEDKLQQLASNAVSKFAPDLGTDFLVDVRRFANAAIAENDKQRAGRELVQVPAPGGPMVAN